MFKKAAENKPLDRSRESNTHLVFHKMDLVYSYKVNAYKLLKK